jgi:hypothetical protein
MDRAKSCFVFFQLTPASPAVTYHRFHAVHSDDIPSVDHAIKKFGVLLVLFLVCAVVVGCVEATKKKKKRRMSNTFR